jgi:hypothetical protein
LRERFGYRIVKARWAGKSQGTQYPINLRVVGHANISYLCAKLDENTIYGQ